MGSCGRKQIALLGALVVSTIALAAHPAETQAMPAGGDRHLRTQPVHEVAPERRAVPILMYHVIRRPYADAPYPDLYVPRAEFAVQIRWLERHGYEAVTLQRVHDAWKGRATLPRRPIVLSFDDGALSHYTNALPILREHGWPGVLNLDVSNLEPSWGIRPWMVRELVAAGWEIDAHSLTHADLTVLRADGLRREVRGSRMRIRALFDVPANFFCYPAGRYDAAVIDAVEAAGFLGATTTEHGLGRRDEPFTLDRIRIDGGDGAGGLARKLAPLVARG